jgi:peptidyl-prolyl cis-trans isomerase SurA
MTNPKLGRSSHRPHVFVILGGLAAASFTWACRATPTPPAAAPAVSADTWAVVDGRNISREAVEKAYQRTQDTSQPISDEEALTAKLNVLNDFIVQDILLAKAAELKVAVTDAELDAAYNDAKKNISDDAFQQEVTRRGLTTADMREGLRRELLTQKVITQEVVSKITVTDKEVSDFFTANRAQFNLPEEAYHVAQIVVTPVRDGQVANRSGDDATTPQAAAAKVAMLMERLKTGAAFQDLAVGYSEDPETAPRGGDLGFIPVSRVKQAPPNLRDAILNKAPGTVTVVNANGAQTMVLVVAHELAGQRDLSMPEVRQRIVDTLRARKEQLLRSAYLIDIRTNARVVNHFAHRLVEAQSKPPGLQPIAPGAAK